ncbi:hypothetical protein J3R83DRAFT_9816 [Lanmaoa asiatica]|nr:hypothetical protein J3R83DRAFT_9816 [Lanmaoa asiatica]
MTLQPPTSRLPPIAKIAAFTSIQLFESLQYLHSLYRPQVRGSRRRTRCSLNDDRDDVRCVLASDAFERAYAIRWLTALIAQLEERSSSLTHSNPSLSPIQHTIVDTSTGTQPPSESDLPIDTDTLIQQAASLLATCAGVAAAGKLHRRFSFESPVAATGKIHVELTDIPLDNHDYGSVGAQTWGGACVLAEMIAERPDRFGLGSTGTHGLDTRERPLRILELGAGTGLVGLTVARLLQALRPCKRPNPNPTLYPRAIIVLTDLYPPVLDNLQSNIDINFPTVPDRNFDTDRAATQILVNIHTLDWSSFSTTTTETLLIPDMLSTPFDVVFGADIVYEAQHAVWIHDCLKYLLSYSDGSNEDPLFHLVIPLRPTHTFESSTVEEVFGPKDRVSEGSASQRELAILSKESIVCEAYGDGRSEASRTDDDVEYVYYRIGWTQ